MGSTKLSPKRTFLLIMQFFMKRLLWVNFKCFSHLRSVSKLRMLLRWLAGLLGFNPTYFRSRSMYEVCINSTYTNRIKISQVFHSVPIYVGFVEEILNKLHHIFSELSGKSKMKKGGHTISSPVSNYSSLSNMTDSNGRWFICINIQWILIILTEA